MVATMAARHRLRTLARHVRPAASSAEPLPLPPLAPGRHTVAGHPTLLPDLGGAPTLDNAEATRAALACPNRGPLRLTADGQPDPAILEAFDRYGFYVLERAIHGRELEELQADVERMLDHAGKLLPLVDSATGRGPAEAGPQIEGAPPHFADMRIGTMAPLGAPPTPFQPRADCGESEPRWLRSDGRA